MDDEVFGAAWTSGAGVLVLALAGDANGQRLALGVLAIR